MKLKLLYSDIITILFFHISLITFTYLPWYNSIKYAIIAIVGLYLLPKYKLFISKSNLRINLPFIILVSIIIITSFINRDSNIVQRNVLLAGIVYGLIILEAIFFFQYLCYKKRIWRMITTLFYLLLIYLIATDILIVVNPLLFDKEGLYLIGNKFSVVYAHFLLIALYWCMVGNNQKKLTLKNKLILICMLIITVWISMQIMSGSGIIGSFFLAIFILLNHRLSNILSKPLTPVIALLISFFSLLFFNFILSNVYVQFVIVDVLDKDLTLTGRMDIYSQVYNLIGTHFWSGYGHGSSYEISMSIVRYANSQNGLLEILLQYGIFGVFAVLYSIYCCFKKMDTTAWTFPIVAVLYVYIILGTIEITIGLQFFVFLALISCMQAKVNDQKPQE